MPAEQLIEQPSIEALFGLRGTRARGAALSAGPVITRQCRHPSGAGQPQQSGRRNALMRGPHEPAPNLHRKAAAGCLAAWRIVVIAEPDAGDEMGRVADE